MPTDPRNDPHLNHSDNPNDDSKQPLTEAERTQLYGLLSDLCEEGLSESQSNELRAMLAANQQARDLYIRYQHLHAGLSYAEAATQEQPSVEIYPLTPAPPRANSSFPFPPFLSDWSRNQLLTRLGMVATLLVVMVTYFAGGFESTLPEYDRHRVQFVARVIADADCEWGKKTALAAQGGLLKVDDQLDLIAGLVKIRFDSGGEIVLRGPAELRIDSGMSCFLNHGELSANIPPVAHGFTVHTPLGQIVDLGTQFGVNVGDEIEVQVFEGECELYPMQNMDQKSVPVTGKSPFGLFAGDTSKLTLDKQAAVVKVISLPEPAHKFIRKLPVALRPKKEGPNFLAVDSFGQGGPGARVAGRNGGFGWDGPWRTTEDSNNISFLSGNGGAMSRGAGDGVVQRRLGADLAMERTLYFSAEFQLDGDDPFCSVWLELFEFIPHMWSNGDTNLAVIGITDGHLSGRLGPFGDREDEERRGNCGRYEPGSRHLIIGKLEFNAVGDQERLSLWIDPTNATETTPDKIILRDTGRRRADAIAIRCWELEGGSVFGTVGEVRVGRTWLSAIQ